MKCDVFSMGVSVGKMFTDINLYTLKSNRRLTQNDINQKLEEFKEKLAEKFPTDIIDLIMRSMDTDWKKRPTQEEFTRALNQ